MMSDPDLTAAQADVDFWADLLASHGPDEPAAAVARRELGAAQATLARLQQARALERQSAARLGREA